MVTHKGEEYEKAYTYITEYIYMYIYHWISLPYTKNQYNSVN